MINYTSRQPFIYSNISLFKINVIFFLFISFFFIYSYIIFSSLFFCRKLSYIVCILNFFVLIRYKMYIKTCLWWICLLYVDFLSKYHYNTSVHVCCILLTRRQLLWHLNLIYCHISSISILKQRIQKNNNKRLLNIDLLKDSIVVLHS